MNTNSEEVIDHVIDDQDTEFARYLGSYWNVEIGYITKISPTGLATVRGFSLDHGTQITWDNVEVIRVGTPVSSINTSLSGATCLLFRPRSSVIQTESRIVDFGAGLFGKGGIKALPISTGSEDIVQHGTDLRGSWYFQGEGYKVEFAKEQFTLYKKGSPLFSITTSGTIIISTSTYDYRMTAEGSIQQVYYDKDDKIILANIFDTDGTVTTLRLAKDVLTAQQMNAGLLSYAGWAWKEVTSNEGVKTITQYDGNGTELLTITEGNGVSIETKSDGGDIVFNSNKSKITFTNGGKIEITDGSGTITMNNGKVTINNHLEISV